MNELNFSLLEREGKFVSCDEREQSSGPSWFHFERNQDNLNSITQLGVESNIASSLLEETTRPHFNKTGGNGLLLVLRAINLNPNSDPEDMVSLRFWCNGTQLITVMNRRVQAVSFVKDSVMSESSPIQRVSEIFSELIHQTLVRIEKHINKLSEQIELLEESLDENNEVSQSDVLDLKRNTSRLWRFMYPQLESLKKLAGHDSDWIDDNLKHAFKEYVDMMSYYNEELVLIRERCEILSNEITGKINAKVNKNLYTISIISVIFLPLSFITGLLGINVGGIPAATSENGFLAVLVIMGVIFAVQLILLKIFRWF